MGGPSIANAIIALVAGVGGGCFHASLGPVGGVFLAPVLPLGWPMAPSAFEDLHWSMIQAGKGRCSASLTAALHCSSRTRR